MDKEKYQQDTTVDPNNLDLECLNQSSTYEKYGTMYSKAETELAEAEQQVKYIRSKIILDIKRGDFPDIKPSATAGVIEAYYRTHPEHIKAKEKWLIAFENHSFLKQALFALNLKKASLEQLIKLMLNNYFSAPSEPKDLTRPQIEKIQEQRKEIDKQDQATNYRNKSSRTRKK